MQLTQAAKEKMHAPVFSLGASASAANQKVKERTQSHNRTSKLKLIPYDRTAWPLQFICGLMKNMDLHAIRLEVPSDGNVIVGHSHFIKTVEDLYEAIVNTVPRMKFGVAFNEASGACLTRVNGNDDELKAVATRNAAAIGAGHLFVVALRGAYPINIKNRILETPEICSIFCATANPVEVIVAQTEQGRGVLGVISMSRFEG
jgi:uncharacterized protein